MHITKHNLKIIRSLVNSTFFILLVLFIKESHIIYKSVCSRVNFFLLKVNVILCITKWTF